MAIRYRSAQPKDIRKCIEILAAHPVIGPRYGDTLKDIHAAMLSLLGKDVFACKVFEEYDNNGSPARILGAAVASFVRDDFIQEIKRPPFFWGVPEIMRRMKRGESPILTDKEVREDNAGPGLNIYVWHVGVSVEDHKRLDVSSAILTAFIETYRGYRVKELLQQADSWTNVVGMHTAGGFCVDPVDGRYTRELKGAEGDEIRHPRMAGLTRELAIQVKSSWAASIFNYEPPRFGLSRSQQKLLESALAGATDEELADMLSISLSAVKKAWHGIYERVSPLLPELGGESGGRNSGASARGKQKRHYLLAHVRDHPEELRPVSWKRLKSRK